MTFPLQMGRRRLREARQPARCHRPRVAKCGREPRLPDSQSHTSVSPPVMGWDPGSTTALLTAPLPHPPAQTLSASDLSPDLHQLCDPPSVLRLTVTFCGTTFPRGSRMCPCGALEGEQQPQRERPRRSVPTDPPGILKRAVQLSWLHTETPAQGTPGGVRGQRRVLGVRGHGSEAHRMGAAACGSPAGPGA